MSKDTSSFSVSAAKALFEAAKKPEFQKAAVAAAKNPFVRQTAKNVAQDEKARSAVLNAVKDPSGGNKISAAFAVADANRKADGPPAPPHRTSDVSYSETKTAPGKLSSTHSAIRSQLENLHLGGSSASSSFQPSAVSSSVQSTSYASSSSVSPSYHSAYTSYQSSVAPPPPVPRHNCDVAYPSVVPATISTPYGVAKFEYTPAQSDEMALRVGDTVLLHKNVDPMWVYGENQNTRAFGIVPSSYLDIKIPIKEAFVSPPSGTGLCATALYDYNSVEPGDLSFSAGDRIEVISRLNTEWLEGELRGRKGMFPTQYVDCPNLHTLPMKESIVPQSSAPTFNAPAKTVTVAFDYNSGVATDLRVLEGDVITVLDDIDADWLYAECHGQQGMIPKNFLGAPYGSPKKQPIGIAEIANAFSPKKAVATGDFHTNDPKNLYVTKGDRLLIIEDVDEYYFRGRQELFKTLPPGTIPKNIVQFTD